MREHGGAYARSTRFRSNNVSAEQDAAVKLRGKRRSPRGCGCGAGGDDPNSSQISDALPNAACIGFIGTPSDKTDANTRAVFGGYVSIYDIQRAVADKSKVPISYESRVSKLSLNASEVP